ncbi:FtsX-like permease family protein [Streptomyces caniscabiei]|uniref:ABC transporter permease n=1 Tax=Streptomyces caniscabiei TaxID=2746961 RepID=UPI0029A47FEA|nr:FtsX-like permease family protein [Streptomyces caniscabiei]MDX2776036.1 FtsX-like permease family protein [Streptomyces caniscabiei]
MNVVTRGVRSALRSPLRSGAIIAMLAVSSGLILAMLVARSSVDAKIAEVKASVATQITVNPAGMQGGMGSGEPLTAEQVEKIKNTEHVSSVSSTLTKQLTENVSLTPSLDPPKLFMMGPDGENKAPEQKAPVVATGTTTPEKTIPEDKLTNGSMIDGTGTAREALVGKQLAEKNSLSVGDTFTLYDKTITVKGIYSTDNRFQDGGIILPLATLQDLSDQSGEVSSVIATVDSSDNVSSTVSALKNTLGDDADVTSQEKQAEETLAPLTSIANLALAGVIGATIAGAAIVLFAMVMVVRERRREIGVIKAIGGSNRSIVTQFITEGLTLTVVGGIIGLALGVAVSGPLTQSMVSNTDSGGRSSQQRGITQGPMNAAGGSGGPMMRGGPNSFASQLGVNLTTVTSSVTPQTFALSGAIVILIAIIGSAVPAWTIARIRPAEVLRTE